MEELVCSSVGVYREALTRGEEYVVLDRNDERQQIRVKGDNGRIRWFPRYHFCSRDEEVPVLAEFLIDDDLIDTDQGCIEVVISLSNGERRFCWFATPTALGNCGEMLGDTGCRYHYCNRHFVIATDVSRESIGRVLREIESQGCLLECTLPCGSD